MKPPHWVSAFSRLIMALMTLVGSAYAAVRQFVPDDAPLWVRVAAAIWGLLLGATVVAFACSNLPTNNDT
jgi:hypothetical protein